MEIPRLKPTRFKKSKGVQKDSSLFYKPKNTKENLQKIDKHNKFNTLK